MKNNSLIKKFLSFSYGSILGVGFAFLSTMILTRVLKPEELGKASIFEIVLNALMIITVVGVDQTFVRFFYEEEEKKRKEMLYNCLKIVFVLTMILIVFIGVFHQIISIKLFDEINIRIICFLILGIILQNIYRFSLLVVRMKQKAHLFSLLTFLNNFLKLVLVFLFLPILGNKFDVVVLSTVFTLFILVAVSVYKESEMWKFECTHKHELKHSINDIMRYSFPLFISTLMTWFFQSFDRIALKLWSSLEDVGKYSAAMRLVGILTMFQIIFATFWAPVSYSEFEKNPNNKEFYEKMIKTVSFGMISLTIIIMMFRSVIFCFLGNDYREASIIFPLLLFMPLMYTISETTVVGINFLKKPKLHIYISLLVCLLNVPLNYFFVNSYDSLGAALATAITYILFFILRTELSQKLFKLKFGKIKIYINIFLLLFYAFILAKSQNELINFVTGICMIIYTSLVFKEIIKPSIAKIEEILKIKE